MGQNAWKSTFSAWNLSQNCRKSVFYKKYYDHYDFAQLNVLRRWHLGELSQNLVKNRRKCVKTICIGGHLYGKVYELFYNSIYFYLNCQLFIFRIFFLRHAFWYGSRARTHTVQRIFQHILITKSVVNAANRYQVIISSIGQCTHSLTSL